MTDDDGHCPPCAAALEVAGTAWDAYETYKTVRDPNASKTEKVVTTVAAVVGVFLPGGGYSTLAKTAVKKTVGREVTQAVAKKADDAVGAAKPTARGVESEKRVLDDIGETKNTKKVSSPEGNSVPDYQNKTTVGEIKDTKRVSDTRQIRIQRDAAGASKRKHVVHTGSNTRVSRRVQEGSEVRRRKDLGPQ